MGMCMSWNDVIEEEWILAKPIQIQRAVAYEKLDLC